MSRRLRHGGRAGAFALVTSVWLAGIVVTGTDREPYPALIQPGFGRVPQASGLATGREVRLTVRHPDGRRVAVDFRALFPPTLSQTDAVAFVAFSDERTNAHPDTVEWVRQRLLSIGAGSPTALEVTWVSVRYAKGEVVDHRVLRTVEVRLDER